MRRNLLVALLYALTLVYITGVFEAVTLPFGLTIVALPAIRQGNYISGEADVDAATVSITIIFSGIPITDYENLANSLSFDIEMAHPVVEDWHQTGGMTWQGGRYVEGKTGEVDPPPSVNFDARPWLSQGYTRIRAHATVPNAMIIGVTADVQ